MRFFFKSRQFKIILAIFSIVLVVSLIFGIIGAKMAPHTDLAGIVAAPFRALGTKVSNAFTDFNKALSDGNALMLENAELKAELNEMREKMAEYEKIKTENELYKDYLEIKEANPDFKFASATLISRDSDDIYGSFLINKGSLSGISVMDPVITKEGLVGCVFEVGTTTAKVKTILNPDITLGALDNRTSDSGIISGGAELAKKNICRFSNLSRSCSVAVGDYVVTSGEGIFPDGLLIGSINAIDSDKYNTSIYADITPFVNFSEIRDVMVITSFEGQGGIKTQKEK